MSESDEYVKVIAEQSETIRRLVEINAGLLDVIMSNQEMDEGEVEKREPGRRVYLDGTRA